MGDSSGRSSGEAVESNSVVEPSGSERGGQRRARARARAHLAISGSAPEASPAKKSPRRGNSGVTQTETDRGHLASGLSDMALGGGGGVWKWREMEDESGGPRNIHAPHRSQSAQV